MIFFKVEIKAFVSNSTLFKDKSFLSNEKLIDYFRSFQKILSSFKVKVV